MSLQRLSSSRATLLQAPEALSRPLALRVHSHILWLMAASLD